MMKHLKCSFLLLLSIILVSCSSISEPLADQNIQNKLTETADFITLESVSTSSTVGFVYYPGGLVDPHAYLQWQDKLVSLHPGLKIVTVKMPSNLAVFGIDKGMTVLKANPEITSWLTGGHSLGGTMAAELINKKQTAFKGLVFIASYPASDKADLPTATVMTGLNNFTLPVSGRTHYYEIMGGNHAQFGNYGLQAGDSTATISTAVQQNELIQVINNFIDKL